MTVVFELIISSQYNEFKGQFESIVSGHCSILLEPFFNEDIQLRR